MISLLVKLVFNNEMEKKNLFYKYRCNFFYSSLRLRKRSTGLRNGSFRPELPRKKVIRANMKLRTSYIRLRQKMRF